MLGRIACVSRSVALSTRSIGAVDLAPSVAPSRRALRRYSTASPADWYSAEPLRLAWSVPEPLSAGERRYRLLKLVAGGAVACLLGGVLLHLRTKDPLRGLAPYDRALVNALLSGTSDNAVDVELAVRHGADVNARLANSIGMTPLHLAVLGRGLPIIKLLVALGADPHRPNDRGQTPLHFAAYAGRATVVDYLVEQGASIAATTADDETPLDAAVLSGSADTVGLLLSLGAAVDHVSARTGTTALNVAARTGSRDIVALLLHAGADVNFAAHNTGATPLITAAYCGHEEIVAVLLASGAHVNAQMADGKTALFAAVEGGHPNIVAMLLDKGAAKNIVVDGRTPRDAARQARHVQIAYLLRSDGDDE